MEDIWKKYDELKVKIRKYCPHLDEERFDKAFNLAVSAHSDQKRASGEYYISHPLEVAIILADMELDDSAIIAGILHDVVEDTHYSEEDIEREFGKEIENLVGGVTKLGKIPYSTKEEQQAENLRKMFLAMARDIRVILIKLADRLHNMRTLKFMPAEKQREKSRETMEIYAPLAHRLGMSKIKWELEDLSLRYLDPIAYHEIGENIAQKRVQREEEIDSIIKTLQDRLDKMNIKTHIEGRAKHFYSIYRKMYAQNVGVDEIYDLLAIRIIVDSISECYGVLGMVHELYKPIPGRFKDYIAMPKKNMYQSLHTSLIGPSGRPFEIQIRTWEMHRIAEVGIAAHWKYKEGSSGASDLDDKLEWLRQILDFQKDVTDAEDFMRSLKIDLFEDEVFVFSPKGDVINLPNGAVPIDFAYSIHSAVGNKTTGAKVNGKIVPLDYVLQNGDIVEIITAGISRGPSMDWLKIIKTNQARKKINEWFKKENREENIERGKDAIERELKKVGIPISILQQKDVMDVILKRYTLQTLDDLFSTVGFGGLAVLKVISRLKDSYKKEPKADIMEELSQKISTVPIKNNTDGVIVKGIDNCLVKFARCCNPVPGDDIIGYITKGRGVSVHRKDCVNIINLENSPDELRRMIEVAWGTSYKSSYNVELQVIADNRKTLFVDTTVTVSELKITMHAINARTTKEGLAVINITVEVVNKEQLDRLIKKLWSITGVTSVIRTKQ